MEFSEKLQMLRRKNSMSQEELADILGVSRQAVSRWESGQGYPETDKLIRISELFSTTLDDLLKDAPSSEEGTDEADRGYYVSRETAEGFLTYKRSGSIRLAVSVAIIILSIVGPATFDEHPLGIVWMFSLIAIGVAGILLQAFRLNPYKALEEQPLVLEPAFARELQARYSKTRRRAGYHFIAGIALIFLGIVFTYLLDTFRPQAENLTGSLFMIIIAIAVSQFIFGGNMMFNIGLLANNSTHRAEQEDDQRYGWITSSLMILAVCIFLLCGFLWDSWRIAWVAFPAAALLGAAIRTIANGIRKK